MSLYCFNLPFPSSCHMIQAPLHREERILLNSRQLPHYFQVSGSSIPKSSFSQPSCCPGARPGPQDQHRADSAVDGKQQEIKSGTEDRSIGYHALVCGLMPYRSFIPEVCVCAHTRNMVMCLFPP